MSRATETREQAETVGVIPATMKAAVIREFGDFDVLHMAELPTPKPGPGKILIKVLAAGINRFDHYIREGSVAPELPFPHVLGTDASGEVAALGEGVTGLRVGERVIPVPGFSLNKDEWEISPANTAPSYTIPGLGSWGSYAQFMEMPARWVLRDTTGLAPEEVAVLPIAVATSVRALKEVGGVKAGDKVLVQAGASGSGSMHIQVAKTLGADVVTTVRNDAKGELAASLGADLVINTRNENFVERVRDWSGGGVDVAIDNLGGDVLQQSIEATRPLGTIVAYGFTAGRESTINVQDFFFTQKVLKGSMASDIKDLEWGLEQVRAGKLKPALDRAMPLSMAPEAHRLVANNLVAGNLVLLPWVE